MSLQRAETAQRPVVAAIWMLGSVAAFTAMAIAGRELAGRHDTFEIMAWRSLIGLAIVCVAAAGLGRLPEVRADRLPQHAMRNLFHFAGQNLWFHALTLIPLAQVFALEFTAPIWVILLSPLFLGERLTPPRLIAAGLGFIGILMVARPDFAHLNAGTIAAALSAICFAATVLMTKALTRGESIVSILFWLTLMQLILGLVCAGHDLRIRWPDRGTFPWLALIGVCGVTAHLCLTTALSLAPAGVVVPVDFLRLPLIAAIGALIYNEVIDPWVIAGGAVIFAGNWVNLAFTSGKRSQRRASGRADDPDGPAR
jgi:drug/metabolite transporter (DMT)-like permease